MAPTWWYQKKLTSSLLYSSFMNVKFSSQTQGLIQDGFGSRGANATNLGISLLSSFPLCPCGLYIVGEGTLSPNPTLDQIFGRMTNLIYLFQRFFKLFTSLIGNRVLLYFFGHLILSLGLKRQTFENRGKSSFLLFPVH